MSNKLFMASVFLAAATNAYAADAGAGRAVFRRDCALCHPVAAGKTGVGPNLAGVVGRPAGSLAYPYSDALKASKLVWTPPALDRFLKDPQATIPGTNMGFAGLSDDADRANVVAYLATAR